MRVAPSVLSFDLSDLKSTLPKIDRVHPDAIHLDVMDGQFVPPISFGAEYAKSLRSHSTSLFEAHLMTLTPERHFQDFADAGCQRIIFHAEATLHSHRLLQQLESLKVKAGLAINPGTPVEIVLPLAEQLEHVLIMTVNPGWGGQSFLDFTLPKISELRRAHPHLTIEVDGGIDPSTIRRAHDAGADLFVVGSYLAKAQDIGRAIETLLQALP